MIEVLVSSLNSIFRSCNDDRSWWNAKLPKVSQKSLKSSKKQRRYAWFTKCCILCIATLLFMLVNGFLCWSRRTDRWNKRQNQKWVICKVLYFHLSCFIPLSLFSDGLPSWQAADAQDQVIQAIESAAEATTTANDVTASKENKDVSDAEAELVAQAQCCIIL